jgi:hypothetical protein
MKITLFTLYSLFSLLTYAQVGIGTITPDPSATLDIESNNSGLLIPRMETTQRTTIPSPAQGLLVFDTNTNSFWFFDSIDWIELLPGAVINVNNGLSENTGEIRLGGPLLEETSITQGNFGMTYNLSGSGDFNIQDNGTTKFSVLDNGDVNADTGTFFVDESTNSVGIGTTTPEQALHIIGTTRISTLAGTGTRIVVANDDGDLITQGLPNGDNLGNHSATTNIELNGNYLSGDGGNEGLTVDNTGEVGIRTLNPGASLHLTQDGTAIGDGMRYTSSAFNGQDWYFYMTTDDDLRIRDDASDVITFQNGSDRVGINTTAPTANLSVNGTANKTGGGAWAAFSDKRLKKDIIPYTDGLSELLQIKPVRFKYIEEFAIKNNPEKEFVGVIAQEIKEVAPYMVETVQYNPAKDHIKSTDNEDDISSATASSHLIPGQDIFSYDPSALNYMLINAVKEQQKMIEKQKTEIKAQATEIQKIKERMNHFEKLLKKMF